MFLFVFVFVFVFAITFGDFDLSPTTGLSLSTPPQIILTTNIAESSITIPDASIVIDTCLQKQQVYDEQRKMFILTETLAPKSTLIQRAGRVGRVKGGACYRLITAEEFRRRREWAEPEILNRPLEEVVLRLVNMKCLDIIFHVLDRPKPAQVNAAVIALTSLGAITGDQGNYSLTDVGYILAQLPVHPSVGLIAYFGYAHDMLEESVITAAILASKNPIITHQRRGVDAYLQRLRYSSADSDSDVIAGVRAYFYWKEQKRQQQQQLGWQKEEELEWCQRNFLSLFTLRDLEMASITMRQHFHRLGMCDAPSKADYEFLLEGDRIPVFEEEEEESGGPADMDDDEVDPGEELEHPVTESRVTDMFQETRYPDLSWEPVVLQRKIRSQELRAMICGGLPVENILFAFSEESSCRQVEIVLQGGMTREAAKAAIQQGIGAYANFEFTVTTNSEGTKVTVRDPVWNGAQPLDAATLLVRGHQRQPAHVLMVLASKLSFLGKIKVNACHFQEEGFFVPKEILNTDNQDFHTIISLLKRGGVLLDRCSVHHPLYFENKGIYVIAAGNLRQLKANTFISETTLLTMAEMAEAFKIYRPATPEPNDTWRLLWQEIPERARKGTLKVDRKE